MFDKLEVSIRVTLIVSDEEGYNLIRALMSGLNFNKTICNVVLKKDGKEGDLEKEVKDWNRKKKTFVLTTAGDADLKDVATSQVEAALTSSGEYKTKRNEAYVKKVKDQLESKTK